MTISSFEFSFESPVISIFLGEQLQELLENIGNSEFNESADGGTLDIGVHIPKIAKDLSDRNRTSPFAFTRAPPLFPGLIEASV